LLWRRRKRRDPLGYIVLARRALIALLLAGCASAPTLPAPGEWHPESLPAGVLAEADLVGQTVAYSPALLDAPQLVVAAVVLHEVCHLRGATSEAGADCCAAALFGELYGPAEVPPVVEYWLSHGRPQAAIAWLGCAP
jgi:hypothetical protein